MSEKKEKIENLRSILSRINDVAHQEEMDDIELFNQSSQAFAVIGHEDISELIPELYDLLNVRDEMIRAEVVATLGYNTRLGVPEFQLKSYDIFLNDPSEDVKLSALTSWANYYIDSKNKDAILILYNIFIDKNYTYLIRNCAYRKMFVTIGQHGFEVKNLMSYSNFPNTEEEFQSQINWNKLNKILIEYIPEVFKGNLPKIEDEPEKIREISEDTKFIFKLVFWIANLLLWPVITIYIYYLLVSN